MSADVNAHGTTEPIQEFKDKAIEEPAQLQELSRRLHRPGRRPWGRWLLLALAAVVVLLAGLILGRFALP
jgi:hypothetical protein